MKQLRWGILVAAVIIAVVFAANADAERVYSVTIPAFSGGFDFDTGAAYRDPSVLIVTFGEQPDIEDFWKQTGANLADFGESNDVMFAFDQNAIFSTFATQHLVKAATFSDMAFDVIRPEHLDASLFMSPAEAISFDADDVLVIRTDDQTYWKFGNFTRLSDWELQVMVETNAVFAPTHAVPEPGTLVLIGLGVVGMFDITRRKRNAQIRKALILFAIVAALSNVSFPAAAQTFSCENVTQIPKTECQALESLYNSTNGANWTNNTDWLQTNTPCSWYGVGCQDGHVSGLWLMKNQLNGNLPHTIGNLSYLRTIDIWGNALNGALPSEIGNLTHLTLLNLYMNQFSGGIPDEIGNLINLTFLSLSQNQFSGNIPRQIGQLVNLETLGLQTCKFSGTLPSELGNLTKLKILRLYNNQLSGIIPVELGKLSNLEELDCYNNQLTGTIPPELGDMMNVTRLHLGQNQIEGNIPTSFGQLVNLSELYLYGNQLSGVIPSQLGNLIKLKHLWLYDNQLSGNIPAEFRELTSLQTLKLHRNQLTGEIPAELGELVNLSYLHLAINQLTGTIPVELGRLKNLQYLYMHENPLNGQVPVEIGNLTKLERLYLKDTQLHGSLPPNLINLNLLWDFTFTNTNLCEPQDAVFQAWLAGISTLQRTGVACTFCDSVTQIPKAECQALEALYNSTNGANWTNNTGWLQTTTPCSWHGVTCESGHVTKLVMYSNNLTGTIPHEIGNLPNLTNLIFDTNNLSGDIPDEIQHLHNLGRLDLGNNDFTGTIPAWVSTLVNLRFLRFTLNKMTGPIPSDLDKLVYLQYLALDHNQFEGNIPVTLGSLTSLKGLFLDENRLTGTIPPELGNLAILEGLDLHGNPLLSGLIPSELSKLKNMRSLYLHQTPFTGSLPTTLTQISSLQTFWFDQTNLCEPSEPAFQTWLAGISDVKRTNISCFDSCESVTQIPKAECEALTALYTSANGQNWKANTGWLQTNTPCSWFGITCSAGHVTQLNLPQNQLKGNLPANVSNLTSLTNLSLWGNQLSGKIPSELSQLTRLTFMSLSDNQLTGEIPAMFSNLTELGQLGLHHNQLTGMIPNLTNLTKLYALNLDTNQLSGELRSVIERVPVNLLRLDLRGNQFSGAIPTEIEKLTKLQVLILTGNKLTGDVSEALGSLTKLTQLSLDHNQLTGSIAPFIAKLAGPNGNSVIKALYLDGNQFTGDLPAEFGMFSNLTNLGLYDNGFTGSLPMSLMNLTRLQELDYKNTSLCEPQDAAFQAWLTAIPKLTGTNTACLTDIKTLILIDRRQLGRLSSEAEADEVMSKLNTFAAHPLVQGVIEQVENNTAVSAAQDARATDYADTEKANAVADAIKQVVLAQWNAHPELEYIVIVGDDRVIPFYRTIDPITADASGPLSPPDFWTLTDDFYANRTQYPLNEDNCWDCINPLLFLPDLASGRLVESPSQIIGQIDAFLSGERIDLRQAVASGYDAFSDGASFQCATLNDDLVATNCSLIGNSWTKDAFVSLALTTRNDLVSLSSHANSRGFGTPDGGVVSDSEIVAAPANFSRAIWYSIGCHAGKNLVESLDLPESFSKSPDLPESFSIKQATYVANTGYGWGETDGVDYSEKLMWYFTQQLTAGTETTVGKALIAAKNQYYSAQEFMNATHEKVLTESTLYGLPMYQVASPAGTPAPPANPITIATQAAALANGLSKESRAYSWTLQTPTVTSNGTYYSLNGEVTDENGKPVLPVLIDDLGSMADRVHGVVFRGGVYSIVNATPPLQEVVTTQTTASASSSGTQNFNAPGWYPAAFGAFNSLDLLAGRRQTLIATAGQYNPNLAADQQRIFTAMNFEVYAHANATDFTAPTIASVTSAVQGSAATITVQADDPSGIETVVVAYTDGKGAWQSVSLTQSGAAWTGSIPAAGPTEFFVQAVDKAGNVAVDERDGAYYALPLFTVRKAADNSGTGLIMLGKARCEADCSEVSVPVSPTTTLIVKAVASPDSRFVGWERLDGTPIAQHNLRAKPGDTVIAVFERKK